MNKIELWMLDYGYQVKILKGKNKGKKVML